MAHFLRNVLPQRRHKTLVNGSANFRPLRSVAFEGQSPHVSPANAALIARPERSRSARAKKKPAEESFAKKPDRFWWPFSSREEAQRNEFEGTVFARRHAWKLRRKAARRANNARVSRLLRLVGNSCTFTVMDFPSGKASVELCNLHYVRTFEYARDPHSLGQHQRNNEFFGLFDAPVFRGEPGAPLREREKPHIRGAEPTPKARAASTRLLGGVKSLMDSKVFGFPQPKAFPVRADKRYRNGLSRVRFSDKKTSSVVQRLYLHDWRLFAETFAEVRFLLQTHDLSGEETEQVLCNWLCGVFLPQLFRACAVAVPRCERRQRRLLARTASRADRAFLKPKGVLTRQRAGALLFRGKLESLRPAQLPDLPQPESLPR